MLLRCDISGSQDKYCDTDRTIEYMATANSISLTPVQVMMLKGHASLASHRNDLKTA